MLIQKQYYKLIFEKNLKRDGNIQMFFIIEEVKETVLDFSW